MKRSDLAIGDYHSFYEPYIKALGEVDLLEMLERQLVNFPQFLASIPEDKLSYSYGENKWTVAEALVHILDAERIFQYRALRIGRGDITPLASFDQDAYVPQSHANTRTLASIIEEYKSVRQSTLSLFQSFPEKILHRKGTASNAIVSVGALGFMICGHQKHHKGILKERYL